MMLENAETGIARLNLVKVILSEVVLAVPPQTRAVDIAIAQLSIVIATLEKSASPS